MANIDTYLHPLPEEAQLSTPPPRFNFPFHYRPHSLALAAARKLQEHLGSADRNWHHDFGLEEEGTGGGGKMFGVLVVRDRCQQLYYLAAYSGKLADSNDLPGFVPPVFDLLEVDGFYKRGEAEINQISERITALETSPAYHEAERDYTEALKTAELSVAKERQVIKIAKENRRRLREEALDKPADQQAALDKELSAQSIRRSYGLKDLKRALDHQIKLKKKKLDEYSKKLLLLRSQRSAMSADLQGRIFARYTFLNARKEPEDLGSIFARTVFETPPAGAGECAAPKLLQFAYLHDLQPVTMAEFWWGQSPASEIRTHGHFYPACRGKCEPILSHMLQGLEVDPNPMLQNPAVGKKLAIVYEDDLLLVINKPPDFLSVPGKHIEDSVWLRIKTKYPQASGPLIVHRLDMSTSGLMLVTKTKDAHKLLQRQFFRRTVRKRYVALVEGSIKGESGTIDLPLRGDLTDRPRQIVCSDHGKTARSHWEVIERRSEKTLVHLWPVTGRTHQLRVHSAHVDGLNCPIVGDDLYGQPADRLYLHAESIEFVHPTTKKSLHFEVKERFNVESF